MFHILFNSLKDLRCYLHVSVNIAPKPDTLPNVALILVDGGYNSA